MHLKREWHLKLNLSAPSTRCVKHLPHSLMKQRRLLVHSLVHRRAASSVKRSYNFSSNKRACAKATNFRRNVRLQMLTLPASPMSLSRCRAAPNSLSTPNFPLIASSKPLLPRTKICAMNSWQRTPKIYSSMLMHLPSAAITSHKVRQILSFSSCPLKPFSLNHFALIHCSWKSHLRSASRWQLQLQ